MSLCTTIGEQWTGWRIAVRIAELVIYALLAALLWPLTALQVVGLICLLSVLCGLEYTEGYSVRAEKSP